MKRKNEQKCCLLYTSLEHPNIVNIYDVGSENGMHYIVMEYVDGITLKTYIEKKGKLTYKEAVSIAIQVGRGIELSLIHICLVGGVNDTDEDAERLVKLVSGMNCHINLIPVNPIKERDYVQSDHEEILKFKNKLEKNGINVTIRREMGRDIDGACGQLRKKFLER